MKVVTWKWKGRIITDYYPVSWACFSSHFSSIKIWAISFNRKGSFRWYNYLAKTSGGDIQGWKFEAIKIDKPWQATRLTIRYGKRLVIFSKKTKFEIYYRNITILSVKEKGKVIFPLAEPKKTYKCPAPRCNWSGHYTKEEIIEHYQQHITSYEMLEKSYPQDTWRQ